MIKSDYLSGNRDESNYKMRLNDAEPGEETISSRWENE